MKVELTGNPFVDTGILTIKSHLAKENLISSEEDLTTENIKMALETEGDFGRWLAKANRQLKSFFMVVGTNSSLVNPSNNKRMNKSKNYGFLDDEDTGWKSYVGKLAELSSELISNDELAEDAILCESCGERPATNVVESIGRDYFPLAGSIGSDAQALPAASRSPKICSLCLIAVQWLPLGTCVFNRGLACFQFTEPQLSEDMTQSIYDQNRQKLETSKISERIPILFSSEDAKTRSGGGSLGVLLLERIRELNEKRHRNNLPESVSLNIWVFSNAGQSADCAVYEIPNPSLQFFWEGLKQYTDLNRILQREDLRKPATHLLAAIEQQKEYFGFYPQKPKKNQTKSEIATIKLFELYQTKVLRRPQIALDAAKLFARLAHEKLAAESATDKKQKKFFEQILKENPRSTKDQNIRVGLRKMLVGFAEAGKIKLDHYVALFPAANVQDIANLTPEKAARVWRTYQTGEQPKGEAIRRTSKGWDLFWFYFHHAENGTLDSDSRAWFENSLSDEEIAMFTNPKVKEFAADVFEMIMMRRGANDPNKGLERIKKDVVDNFARGKISATTLRDWFALLSKSKDGYTNEDWDSTLR